MIKFLGCFIQTFARYASFEFNEKCKPLNVFAKTAVLEKYIIHKKTKLIPDSGLLGFYFSGPVYKLQTL